MNTPTLSVCMIVRDDADVLDGALSSVRGLADEILVVDTGSLDTSVDIARRHGARVVNMEWPDSFALARNRSLDAASGNWALVLDADEWLDARSFAAIRQAMRCLPQRAYVFEQRNYVTQSAVVDFRPLEKGAGEPDGAVGYVVARQTRLFPRAPGIVYEGAVHEEVRSSLEHVGLERMPLDVVVHHVGRMRDRASMQRKAKLYEQLGERKLDESGDAAHAVELAVQRMELGRAEGVEELLLGALEDERATDAVRARAAAAFAKQLAAAGEATRALERLERLPERLADLPRVVETLCSLQLVCDQVEHALRTAASGLEREPDSVILLRLRGTAELRTERYHDALVTYERLARAGGVPPVARIGAALAAYGGGDARPARRLLQTGPAAVAEALLQSLPRHFSREARVTLLRSAKGPLGTAAAEVERALEESNSPVEHPPVQV